MKTSLGGVCESLVQQIFPIYDNTTPPPLIYVHDCKSVMIGFSVPMQAFKYLLSCSDVKFHLMQT